MKKIGNLLKNNIKLLVGIVIGGIIFGGGVYAATVISSSNVGYTDTNSIVATTVQAAIDKIGERANTWIDPSYIDFTILATNTKKTILASSEDYASNEIIK